jgi:hypothetical protein
MRLTHSRRSVRDPHMPAPEDWRPIAIKQRTTIVHDRFYVFLKARIIPSTLGSSDFTDGGMVFGSWERYRRTRNVGTDQWHAEPCVQVVRLPEKPRPSDQSEAKERRYAPRGSQMASLLL